MSAGGGALGTQPRSGPPQVMNVEVIPPRILWFQVMTEPSELSSVRIRIVFRRIPEGLVVRPLGGSECRL